MLKVTKCIGVKSFVEALINMVCELKITSGCKNFMVIRHSIKELLAKSMVTRPMKCIVDTDTRYFLKKYLDTDTRYNFEMYLDTDTRYFLNKYLDTDTRNNF